MAKKKSAKKHDVLQPDDMKEEKIDDVGDVVYLHHKLALLAKNQITHLDASPMLVVDPKAVQQISSLEVSANPYVIAALPDGLCVTNGKGNLDIWDIASSKVVGSLGDSDSRPMKGVANTRYWYECSDLLVLPDGTLAAVGCEEFVRIWDVKEKKCIKSLQSERNNVFKNLILLQNGMLAVTGYFQDSSSGSCRHSKYGVSIFDLATAKCICFIPFNMMAVSCETTMVALPKNLFALGIVGCDGSMYESKLYILDACTGETIKILEEQKFNVQGKIAPDSGYAVRTLTVLPDGKLLAGYEKTIDEPRCRNIALKVWDISSGKCIVTIDSGLGSTPSVTLFSHGILAVSHSYVSGYEKLPVKIYDISTWNHIGNIFPSAPGIISTVQKLSHDTLAISGYNKPFLEIVSFSRPAKLTDVIALFQGLMRNKSVTDLNLSRINLDEQSLQLLAEIIKIHPTLKVVDLSYSSCTDKTVEHILAAIKVNPRIISLNLTGNEISSTLALRFNAHLRGNQKKCLPAQAHFGENEKLDAATEAARIQFQVALQKSGDQEIIRLLPSINESLLQKPLVEELTLLTYIAKHKTSALLENVFQVLGDRVWALPETDDGGIQLFITIAQHMGTDGAKHIIKFLYWAFSDLQKQLWWSITNGNVTVSQVCLDLGGKLGQPNESKEIPWHVAVKEKQYPLIAAWLERKDLCHDDFSLRNREGNTLLHLFIINKLNDLLNLLLGKGHIDQKIIDLPNNLGKTPLQLALDEKQWSMVKELIIHKANLEIANAAGRTILLQLVEYGQIDLVTLALDHGAKIETVDKGKNNALHIAAQQGSDIALVKLIMHHGLNAKSVNAAGKRPTEVAKEAGYGELASFIEDERHRIKLAPFLAEAVKPFKDEKAELEEKTREQTEQLVLLQNRLAILEKEKVRLIAIQETFHAQLSALKLFPDQMARLLSRIDHLQTDSGAPMEEVRQIIEFLPTLSRRIGKCEKQLCQMDKLMEQQGLGEQAASEREYISSQKNLQKYYVTIRQHCNEVYLAALVIKSGMVKDDRKNGLDYVLRATALLTENIPGVAVIIKILTTGIDFIQGCVKARSIDGLVSVACDANEFALMIETFARRLTIEEQKKILGLDDDHFVGEGAFGGTAEKAKQVFQKIKTGEQVSPIVAEGKRVAEQVLKVMMLGRIRPNPSDRVHGIVDQLLREILGPKLDASLPLSGHGFFAQSSKFSMKDIPLKEMLTDKSHCLMV